jgi:hypothetical protein
MIMLSGNIARRIATRNKRRVTMIHAILFRFLDESEKNNNAQQDESDNDSCSSVDTSVLLDGRKRQAEESRAKLEKTKAELKEWRETAAREKEEREKKWEKYDREEKARGKRASKDVCSLGATEERNRDRV